MCIGDSSSVAYRPSFLLLFLVSKHLVIFHLLFLSTGFVLSIIGFAPGTFSFCFLIVYNGVFVFVVVNVNKNHDVSSTKVFVLVLVNTNITSPE